ncbi:MAG TPA: dihydrodipicolinate reductase [Candidatus Dormibacteraeota bacterium]|nr:dihydrodipicolinate reductase [Candidatus Dormibacteraeota bacterium]
MTKIKVAQFGLGPIGIETLKLAALKPWAQVVGGIDVDPAKNGKNLADLTGISQPGSAKVFGSIEELLAAGEKPDVIFHTSVSKLKDACAQIEPIASRGISVVSSCEELLFPAFRDAGLAARLDEICKQSGARVLGTGVNPGFVMDVLPLCLTGVCREVRAVHVQRVVNASTRRGPLQKKIGSGMPPAEFERLFKAGKAGHAGLKDSAALIAHCLGWKLTNLTESCEAVVADHDIKTQHVEVKKGQCCGLHQRAEGTVNGAICLTLDLQMFLEAPNPHDACQIEGTPPLNMRLEGGVAGDSATVASLVNSARRILKAAPGLLLMTDIGVPSFA